MAAFATTNQNLGRGKYHHSEKNHQTVNIKMARTKQTARQQTGGKAPQKDLTVKAAQKGQDKRRRRGRISQESGLKSVIGQEQWHFMKSGDTKRRPSSLLENFHFGDTVEKWPKM